MGLPTVSVPGIPMRRQVHSARISVSPHASMRAAASFLATVLQLTPEYSVENPRV